LFALCSGIGQQASLSGLATTAVLFVRARSAGKIEEKGPKNMKPTVFRIGFTVLLRTAARYLPRVVAMKVVQKKPGTFATICSNCIGTCFRLKHHGPLLLPNLRA
jgi:hypothetical protein